MLLYYIQTNVFCIILFLIMFLDIRRKEATKDQKLYFLFILDATLFCIADMLNYILSGNMGGAVKPLLYIINTVYFSASVLASYIWYLYVLAKLGYHKGRRHIIRYLMMIPFCLFLVISSLSPVIGWIFTITDENTYQRGSALWIHWIFAWGYIVIPTVLTLIHIIKEKDKNQRKQIYPLFIFALFPVIASIVQIFIPSSSLIQVGMVLSSVIVYIKVQDRHVLTDTLTGLYNRSYFDRYLTEKVKLVSKDAPIFLLMMDIDDLKGVNSIMGRGRGDEILKSLAYVIQKTSQKYPKTAIARYDNDEFAMFGYGYELEGIKEIIKNIEDGIKEVNLNSSYSIDVSIGYIKGTKESFVSVDQMIDLADLEMHKVQNEKRGILAQN